MVIRRNLSEKHIEALPTIITFLQIPFSITALIAPPFSTLFWIFYLGSGLTDILDGFVARKLHCKSTFGARLDSAADFVFALCLAIFAVINIKLPTWLWLCISVIALLRFAGYGIGFYKYRAFAALHTWANKITGMLIFIAPVLYCLFGTVFMGIVLCAVAFASACEELVIIIKSEKLNREPKGGFCYALYRKKAVY